MSANLDRIQEISEISLLGDDDQIDRASYRQQSTWNGKNMKIKDAEKPGYSQFWGILNNIFCFPCAQCFWGFVEVKPYEAVIISYNGKPVELLGEPGIYHFNSAGLETKTVSLALYTIKMKPIQVNDGHGSPIVITAEVVWNVVQPIVAEFSTADGLGSTIELQAEAALREVASNYPYDVPDDTQRKPCLRQTSQVINDELKTTLEKMVSRVGVAIDRFRIVTVKYPEEMQKVMQLRQQAQSEFDAKRTQIDGIVGVASAVVLGMEEKLNTKFPEKEKQELATNLTYMMMNPGTAKVNLFLGPGASTIQPIIPL